MFSRMFNVLNTGVAVGIIERRSDILHRRRQPETVVGQDEQKVKDTRRILINGGIPKDDVNGFINSVLKDIPLDHNFVVYDTIRRSNTHFNRGDDLWSIIDQMTVALASKHKIQLNLEMKIRFVNKIIGVTNRAGMGSGSNNKVVLIRYVIKLISTFLHEQIRHGRKSPRTALNLLRPLVNQAHIGFKAYKKNLEQIRTDLSSSRVKGFNKINISVIRSTPLFLYTVIRIPSFVFGQGKSTGETHLLFIAFRK